MPIKEKLSINNKLSVTYLVEMKAFTACRHGQMKSPAELIFRFCPTMPANKLILLPCSIYHWRTMSCMFLSLPIILWFLSIVIFRFGHPRENPLPTWQNELHSIVKIAIYDGVQFEKSLRSSILDGQMVQQFGQMGSKKNFYDFLKSKWLINSITEIVKIRDNSKDLNWYQYNIVDIKRQAKVKLVKWASPKRSILRYK